MYLYIQNKIYMYCVKVTQGSQMKENRQENSIVPDTSYTLLINDFCN